MPLPQATPLHWQWLERSMVAIAAPAANLNPQPAPSVRPWGHWTISSGLRPGMDEPAPERIDRGEPSDSLIGIFAIVALALASVGVYGVIAVIVVTLSRNRDALALARGPTTCAG